VMGADFKWDKFTNDIGRNSYRIRGYKYYTAGAFIQDDWRLTDKFTIESGLRADNHNAFGWFMLPRINFLYHFSHSWTTRLNGGLGYKIPDIFTTDEADVDLKRVLPLADSIKAEHSGGANFDVNFHHLYGETSLTINQSFFYTRIEKPVSTIDDSTGNIIFGNYADYTESKGTETYVRLTIEPFDFYIGYTYTLPRTIVAEKTYDILLNARDKFAATAMYEVRHSWKFGVESSYTGSQYVIANETRPGYWFMATMIQKTIKKMSITLNCENLFDFRQSRTEAVVLPPYDNPTFRPIWTSLEGRIVNLAVKVSF
jgi:outer membrane receptor for ferrienterochelin and colicins